MKYLYNLFLIIFFAGIGTAVAQQTFERVYEIPVPTIENTGFGQIVAGVDFDEDGRPDLYAINNMLDQGGSEEIPKIFKFELNNGVWDSVWSATITNIEHQNSWGALTTGDWDQDGKPELIWGPANWLTSGSNENPPRVLVFEYPGDGSDNMGLDIFGNFKPNTEWTITPNNMEELRPIRWELADIDSDGDIELCFVDRRENYRYGIISVDHIPDDATTSAVWTLEASGYDQVLPTGTIYDMAVVDNSLYIIHSDGTVTIVRYANGEWQDPVSLEGKMPGGSWKSASAVDVDGDGQKEIFVGAWDASNTVVLLQPDVFEVLKSTVIADLSEMISVTRLNGGAFGDIDNDGNMDILFGSRRATPRGPIVRLEYLGGNVDDPASYDATIIDSLYLYEGDDEEDQYDVLAVGNIDEDDDLEVFYTDGARIGRTPIVVLDLQAAVSVDEELVPSEFFVDQNYPNPFNPSTTIRFGLNKAANVSLRIYDVLGKHVATLFDNEYKAAGTYDVTFDASQLASGTYIYTLTAGNKVQSKKMILLQ